MKLKKIIALILSLSLFTPILVSCKKEEKSTVMSKSYYEYFDTVSTIFSYRGDSEEEFTANYTAVRDLLDEYHKLLNIYYEYTGINNVKTINENAGIEPVKVDEKLIDFLIYAKEMYTLTSGKMNITLGSVLKLWHDCREDGIADPENAKIPDMDQLTNAAEHCDINNLIIDKAAGTVYIADPEMQLDVGAIGKGYATEKAAELLIERGVSAYVLNIGGNIRTIGAKPDGKGWDTGITHPNKNASEQFITKVNIKDISLVTSGNYERFYTVNGVSYHHIIDPATLMPAEYFSSVSIFTTDGGLADALSTALFCMSYEEGLALIESIGGVDVIWVGLDYSIKHTSGITFI